MSLKSISFVCGLFGLSALGFGQVPSFNFQSYEVNTAFSASGVNRSGVLMGEFFDSALGSSYQTTWSSTQGFRIVTTLAGDKYQSSLSDSGTVFGDSAGKIIQWNATGGRSVLLDDSNYNYSLVSSSDNDRLLIKGINGSETKYFTYQSGLGLQAVNFSSPNFTPKQIGLDGSVYGLVPGGTPPASVPSRVFAKLNGDGSFTVDPHSVANYDGTFMTATLSGSEKLTFLANGTSMVTTTSKFIAPGQTTAGINYHVYKTDGSDFDLGWSSQQMHGVGIMEGYEGLALLGDGSVIGLDVAGARSQAMIFNSNDPGKLIDGSYFQAGSAVPEAWAFGNDKVMVGYGFANGGRQILISNVNSVPEPASMLVLGLGAIALKRRKKK